jgi:hypothetical protein
MSQTIIELLEETRKDRGFSQRRAAEELPTTTTTWRSWSRGQIPGWEWLEPFIKFTGQSREVVVEAIAEQARRSPIIHVPSIWFGRPIDFLIAA